MRRVKIAVRILGWSAIAAVVALMMGLMIPGAGLVPTILGLGWLLLRLQPGYATERKRRREAAATAEHAFSQIKQEWERGLGDVVHRFGTRMRDLEVKRAEYTSLPGRYQAERTALERQREAAQRRRFLERYFIEKHRIPKIGPGLKATLASYGIETAADVSSRTVSAVPGFGATRTKELVLWRQGIERRFAFDPAKGVDPADVRALDLKFG